MLRYLNLPLYNIDFETFDVNSPNILPKILQTKMNLFSTLLKIERYLVALTCFLLQLRYGQDIANFLYNSCKMLYFDKVHHGNPETKSGMVTLVIPLKGVVVEIITPYLW